MIPGGERSEVPMEIEKNQINKKASDTVLQQERSECFFTLGAVVVSTYAWYVYNTGRHTTKSTYGSRSRNQSADQPMPTMVFMVLPPYWTAFPASSIRYRRTGSAEVFRKCSASQTERKTSPIWWRICLEEATTVITIKTSLFLRSNGKSTDIYLSDIGFEDSDENNPISSAIRAGFVIHQAGLDQPTENEYIFEISDKKESAGGVQHGDRRRGLRSGQHKTDGTTVPFQPYNEEAYCIYDKDTGEVTKKEGSLKLCTVTGTSDGKPGTPVQIDLYIWLEGCDEDCTGNLSSQTLKILRFPLREFQIRIKNDREECRVETEQKQLKSSLARAVAGFCCCFLRRREPRMHGLP